MHTLVLSMPPWRFATRTKKAAQSYSSRGRVTFVAPQGVGRTGKWDKAGTRNEHGVRVVHVPVRPLGGSPGRLSMGRNLLLSYLPALARLARTVLKTRADVVHVTGAPLIPVALAHRCRFGSRIVLDINERPASVSSPGSLFSVVSRLEPRLLHWGGKGASITTVVTEGHADLLREVHGWQGSILVVRNAPTEGWRADWTPPPPGHLRVVTVGTIFERRGFELIIDAAKACRDRGSEITVDIHGSGRSDYVATLAARISHLGLDGVVRLHGPLAPQDVSAAYRGGHLGLAFYEPSDPGNDSLSNKIIECIASGRPVLAGNLTENRRFVEDTGGGWLTPLNVDSIADALIHIDSSVDVRASARHCRDIAHTLTWEYEFGSVLRAVDSYQSEGIS